MTDLKEEITQEVKALRDRYYYSQSSTDDLEKRVFMLEKENSILKRLLNDGGLLPTAQGLLDVTMPKIEEIIYPEEPEDSLWN